jgi:hypothetical protein
MQTATSRSWAYAAGLVLEALLIIASGGVALAQDDTPLQDKIYNGIMAPFRREPAPERSIEYRERSPLVIPPTTELPTPQSASAPPPAWPKDAPRPPKRAATKKDKSSSGAQAKEASEPVVDGDHLSRLKGTVFDVFKGSTDETGNSADRFSNLNGSIFDVFTGGANEGTFTGEPPRESVIEPPPGYQTPSPAHPYGLYGTKKTEKSNSAISSFMDHAGQDPTQGSK